MIWGEYDAKSAKPAEDGTPPSGFFPGGSSLHNTMTPHGPDTGAFVGASAAPIHDNPVFFDKGMAFMFETSYLLRPTLEAPTAGGGTVAIDQGYAKSWQPLPKRFDPVRPQVPTHNRRRAPGG